MSIDDNRDAADSAALLLERYGYAVAVCYDGAAALAAALRFEPDVCLIDLNMPGLNGYELAERLTAWRRSRPVYLVAVTAYGGDRDRAKTARAGFARHLVKPLDWGELFAALADLEVRLRCAAARRRNRPAGADAGPARQ
jgi:CheY-like chemotaxis protein